MRIPSTKIWLAVGLSLGRVRAKGPNQPALVFKDDSFTGLGQENLPILILDEQDTSGTALPRMFLWDTTNQNLTITQVSLYVFNETTQSSENPPIAVATVPGQDLENGDGNDTNTGMASLGGPSTATVPRTTTETTETTSRNFVEIAHPTPPIRPRAGLDGISREERQVKLSINSFPAGGSVTIDDVRKLVKYHGRQLYFGAAWPNNMGETFSRAFTVVQNFSEFEHVSGADSPFRSESPVQQEANYTISTPSATQVPPPSGRLPTSAPAPASESPNEGGLATGAIIGIAVACGILGLILIAVGIWFLIRRRAKQSTNNHQPLVSPGGPYGAHRSRTDDLIAEKEASGGSGDPSPHSPYSDDGVGLVPSAGGNGSSPYHHGTPGVPAGPVAGTPVLQQQIPRLPQPHDQHGRSYTPYSDRGSINGSVGAVGGGSPSTHAASIAHSPNEETARSGMGSPTAGRATPHSSLAPRYAHLVEEGMTEDEIRRLEDEERQLDADIEEARQR